MRKEYESFITAIETATDNAVEYETGHEDSGSNYTFMIPDGLAYNNGEQRFADWLTLHGIPEKHATECLQYLIDTDSFEMESGSIFGVSPPAYYSKDEYHAADPERFVADSYSIGEVETQLELATLSDSKYAPVFARMAEDNNRVCTRYSEGSDNLLSYEATDCVWFAIITLESVTDWLKDCWEEPAEETTEDAIEYQWNRFDICEAFNLLAHDWGLYDVKARLDNMHFKASPSAEFYDGLSDNGKDIFNHHNALLKTGDSPIKSNYKPQGKNKPHDTLNQYL